MAVKYNNAEGGTSGNNVTTSDTNSGDAWNTVSIGTSATVQWSNTHAAHDSLSVKFATGSTSTTAYVAWTGLSIARIRGRANVYITSATPAVSQLIARGMASSAQKFRIYLNTAGKLVVADSANTSQTTFTSALPANTWFRVEWDITAGTSAAYEVRFYNTVDATTATETGSGSTSNFGSGNFDEIRFGTSANFANVVNYWLDDFGISDTAFMGPALKTGTASGGLGGLSGSAASQRTVLATASADLGALAAAASGARLVHGSALAGLGALSGSAAGLRTVVGAASGDLGVLSAAALGQREVVGIAVAPLGVLAASAAGVVIPRLQITLRPDTGATSRPSTGITTRPDTGITTRP